MRGAGQIILLFSIISIDVTVSAASGGKKGTLLENLKHDFKTLRVNLFDAPRQKQRGIKLLSDLQEVVQGAYVGLIGPFRRDLEKSWISFTWRVGKLLQRSILWYESAATKARKLHVKLLDSTQRSIASTMYVQDLLPEHGCELLLLNVYLVLGALLAWLVVAFVRNVLYA